MLDGVLELELPRGGMALWAQAPGVDVDGWAAAALRRGVGFHPGGRFAFDGRPRPSLRLGYGAHPVEELRDGVMRIAAALADVQKGGRTRRRR